MHHPELLTCIHQNYTCSASKRLLLNYSALSETQILSYNTTIIPSMHTTTSALPEQRLPRQIVHQDHLRAVPRQQCPSAKNGKMREGIGGG